jgi:acyl carrier protein
MKTKEEKIYDYIICQLTDKMNRTGLSEKDLSSDFNLTKSGLLDSLSFVNLVVQIEKKYGIEIDFEKAFQNPDFTNISGLINVIIKDIK